jgi:hypothetical protein
VLRVLGASCSPSYAARPARDNRVNVRPSNDGPQQTLYAFVGSLWLVVDSRLHPLNDLALQSNEIRTTTIVNPIPETFPLQECSSAGVRSDTEQCLIRISASEYHLLVKMSAELSRGERDREREREGGKTNTFNNSSTYFTCYIGTYGREMRQI